MIKKKPNKNPSAEPQPDGSGKPTATEVVSTFNGFLSPVDILETAFQKFLQGKKIFIAREVAFAIRSVMEAKPLKRKQFP